MRTANFRREQKGQTLVIVALMVTVLLGFTGLVTDVAWYEVNLMRIQRAADAAALAGVVYLPNNIGGAQTAAEQESSKNGYTKNVGGVDVSAVPEALNNRILNVTVSSPIRSWFSRLFGINQFSATRNARAEFVLPVPMGSPQDYYGINVLCRNSDTPPNCPQVASASTGNLAPLGFFGGVEGRGGDRQNGDAYSPYYNPNPTLNAGYDPNGYQYIVEFGPGTVNGTVWVYDPMFCATGAGTSTGRRLGVGDFWFANGGNGFSTVYNLMDMNGTPYTLGDDTLIATSGALFKNSDAVDKGATYRGDQNYGGGSNGSGSADCQNSQYHNRWWQLATGLTEGQYRLQVVSSSGSLIENGINGFGLQATATAGPSARVYGQSRMEAFIVINNTSVFYLAQIEASHAGKTLEIKLFDPGDISSTTFKIRLPTTTGFIYPSFTYTTTGSSCGAPTSGGPTTSLTTSSSSCNFYNNQWVTISVPIPSTYTAPTPPGEPGPGWWKIEYGTLGTGQDITTWEVNIRGNPVHLITP